ncbi:MAG: ACT domain-containing protein [Candidatus Omnitrophica bacterium]|nr:ACT domain-containing protein [Candidatus Omnitrophota bacterium]
MARQISIFLENKPGRISRITGILAKSGINFRASTIADSGTFGIFKIITDHNEKAYQALKEAGCMISFQEVVIVEIPDRVGAFHRIAQLLEEKRINIEDVYCILIKRAEKAALVLKVSQPDQVEKILKQKKYRLLSEEDL